MTIKQKSQTLHRLETHYKNLIEQYQGILPQSVTSRSKEIFIKHGLPNSRHEDWKYTTLDNLYSADLYQAETISHATADHYRTDGLPLSHNSDSIIISAINRTTHGHLPKGLTINFYNHHLSLENQAIEKPLSQSNQALTKALPDDPMLALNQALCTLVINIEVDSNTVIESPIVIDYGNGTEISYELPRIKAVQVIVSCAQSTEITLIEYHRNGVSQQELNLISCHFKLKKNAQCKHFSLSNHNQNNQRFWYAHGSIANDAHLHSNAFVSGEQLVRSFFCTDLNGEGAGATINSAYHANQSQTIDIRTLTRHLQPRCNSVQLHQGLLDGQSNGVFNGMIYVDPKALKTDGQMDNNVMLLATTAQNSSKPQLEIYADDVKCSHGFTCGTIDENQLYYMRSRGIAEAIARQHILKAFISRVTENFPSYIHL